MELITCDNLNMATMRNVLYLANERFPEIDGVFFLETAPCAKLVERNVAALDYLGSGVELSQRRFDPARLHSELPAVLAHRLRKAGGRERLVIDMTNGTKMMSSVLYASASLLKIPNLFFLTVERHAQNKRPEELTLDDYSIQLLKPIQQDRQVGKAGLFEVLYYRDGFVSSLAGIDRSKLRREYTRASLEADLLKAVDQYFDTHYRDCVRSISVLAEALAEDLCHGVNEKAGGNIRKPVPHNDASKAVDWLRVEFGEPLRAALSKDNDRQNLPAYQRELASLATADTILAQLRPLRNFSVHPYMDIPGASEARVALHSMLYLLEMISRSGVFR